MTDPDEARPPPGTDGARARGPDLAHVRWIGGAPDAGKTSLARHLSRRLGWPVYHYDAAAPRHHRRLAETSSAHAGYLAESPDARWVWPEPGLLAAQAWQTFRDRFPLALEDLTALDLPPGMKILAEGFGLVPELVAPLLARPEHAVVLMPSSAFRQGAMQAAGKGRFEGLVADPARAALNLLERDRQLAERIRAEAGAAGLAVLDIDGAEDVETLGRRLEARFA